MYAPPLIYRALKEQPVENIAEACGIYCRAIVLEETGLCAEQHVHEHDHATLVCSGRARLWVDDVWQGDYEAGTLLEVRANRRHMFQALAPATRLACLHILESAKRAMTVPRKGV